MWENKSNIDVFNLKSVTYIFVLTLFFQSFIQAQVGNSAYSTGNALPNVIVILADDIGVGDISHYRRLHSDNIALETPNIDALAASGMTFTQAHAPAALCSPTRYGIMTGNHCYRAPHPAGVWGAYEASDIKESDLTLGRLMQKAGYHTGFFGKWNLGGDFYRLSQPGVIYRAPRVAPELDIDITKMISGPQQKGFDYDLTFPSGIQDVPYAVFENGLWMPLADDSEIIHITQARMDSLNVVLDKDEGLGDSNWDPHNMGPLLAGKAVEYINANANKDVPFFMYYCSQAVHLPHTPPDSINGIEVAGTTPSSHMDMIKELDQQLGMMVAALKAQGVYENTIIIFTSDNGGLPWSTNTSASGHNSSDIYRGGKNSKYEGGHRVPFIVSWPDSIQPGLTTNEAVIGLDIMATLAAISDTKIEPWQAMDSYNLWPLLQNKEDATSHEFLMLQSGTSKDAIFIKDGWKLIMQIDKNDKTYANRWPTDLFDLNTNVTENEAQNLINNSAYQAKIDSMFARYNEIRDSRIPTFNMGNGPDTTVMSDTLLIEGISFLAIQSSIPDTSRALSVDIAYAANSELDIALELKTPLPENESLFEKHFTVPPGEKDTSIIVQLDAVLLAGNDYQLSISLRPPGANENENIAECDTSFNVFHIISDDLRSSEPSPGLLIYPNPAGNELFVRQPDRYTKEMIISIYSLSGQLVYAIKTYGSLASNSSIRLSIDDIENGLYILEMNTAYECHRSRFIKHI